MLASFWNEIQEIDANYAESYLKWCMEKLNINKKHIKELSLKRQLKFKAPGSNEYNSIKFSIKEASHRNIPKNISKGDIVHVKFGVNLGDELTDLDNNQVTLAGHYAIVLAQRGFMFLVLPLTSQPQRENDPELIMILKDLGLPGMINESHITIGKIRSVHIRRINRIHSLSEGKISLTPEKIKELDSILIKFLAINI